MKKSEKIVTKNPLVIGLGILGLILPVLLFLKFYEFYSGAGVPMFVPKPWYVAERIIIYKAGVLSLIGGIITLFFFVKTLKTVGKKSLKNASFTLLIGVITYLSIFVVAPSYTFQNYPRVFMYMDAKGEYIKYPSYYFWLVEKMGFTQFSQNSYKRILNSDDVINGFELAKKNNNSLLYTYLFKNAINNGVDFFIEKYNDETFNAYFLLNSLYVNYSSGSENVEKENAKKFFDNINNIKLLSNISNNDSIKSTCEKVLGYYEDFLKGNINESLLFSNIGYLYKDFQEDILKQKSINYSIF